MSRHRPAGSVTGPAPGDRIMLSPEDAGWQWCGLRVIELAAGVPRQLLTGPAEAFVLPLAGALTVQTGTLAGEREARFELAGRRTVFTAVTDFAYVGCDTVLTLTSAAGAEVAIPSARCERRLPAVYRGAAEVPVEVRGAGQATRQVTNFGVPGVFDGAERLICCELITPPGNWSSYPPHKHDATSPAAAANEELYYYRIAGADQITPSRQGFGLHRTYTATEHDQLGLAAIDDTIEVRDGDVVCVPYGYHGPCVAAPGYPMYYLNVLAGPGQSRSMAFCDDPSHGWQRAAWANVAPDPRCPVTTAPDN